MPSRRFFPVGGTGGGSVDFPFDRNLWREIVRRVRGTQEVLRVGLLATPSKLSGVIDVEALCRRHKALEGDLGCAFQLLDEDSFGAGHYDGKIDLLCITCGNTQGARDAWLQTGCEDVIRSWYNSGVPVTGYSAGFIVFYEFASTDSVSGPQGARFGAMPCMGILKGGAIPHIDSQPQRIPDFQRVLATCPVSPALALGEDVMAIYEDEALQMVVSARHDACARWVNGVDQVEAIEVRRIASVLQAGIC